MVKLFERKRNFQKNKNASKAFFDAHHTFWTVCMSIVEVERTHVHLIQRYCKNCNLVGSVVNGYLGHS